MNNENTQSIFVTVLSWIFIIGSGLFTYIALMQNIMIRLMFSGDPMNEMLKDPAFSGDASFGLGSMFQGFQYFFVVILLIALVSLLASISLLKRKNWARIYFIVMLVISIVLNVVFMVIFSVINNFMPSEEVNAFNHFSRMMVFLKVFSWLTAIGMSVLFGWLIYRLKSPEVKREFIQQNEPVIEEPAVE